MVSFEEQAYADVSGDYEYTNNMDGTATITRYTGSTASNRLRDDISFSHEASTASNRLRDDISFSHEASTTSNRLRDDISFSHEASTASNRLRDDISFSHEASTTSNRLRDDISFSHEVGINDKKSRSGSVRFKGGSTTKKECAVSLCGLSGQPRTYPRSVIPMLSSTAV
jgi:hypothetical protein